MNTITTEQVSQWMREQLAKAHELSEYAHIQVHINQTKDSANLAKVRYSIFLGAEFGHHDDKSTIEECFAELGKETPDLRIEKFRSQAAELNKLAEKLEAAQASTL